MAIAGRSYVVPVIIRGSLEDATDFDSKVPALVVTAQPPGAQLAVPPVTILRNTLADPPVLTTPAPVVVAAAADRRWFAAATVVTAANPQAPPVVPVATPGPLVVTYQPAASQTAVPPVTVLRGTLADPPVLTTPGPVIIAAAADGRWFAVRPPLVTASPQAPAVVPPAQQGTVTISNTLAGLVTIVNAL